MPPEILPTTETPSAPPPPAQGVQMVNRQTGGVETVSFDQVPQAYSSGQYGIHDDTPLNIVSPNGHRTEITGKDLGNAINAGARLETLDESDERQKEEKYGNRPIAAAGIGLARGLSARLSDVALIKSGLVNPETISEIAKRNEAVAIGSEAVGTVAPLLATAGTSALAEAGGQAASRGVLATASKFTAPYLIQKAGELVERPVAEAIVSKLAAREAVEATAQGLIASGAGKAASKSVARMIVEQAIPRGVGSAVEGAFFGGGQLLSENALGDAELNAEAIMSHVGLGMVVGGGLGFASSALGIAAKRVSDRFLKKFGAQAIEGEMGGDLGASSAEEGVPREAPGSSASTEGVKLEAGTPTGLEPGVAEAEQGPIKVRVKITEQDKVDAAALSSEGSTVKPEEVARFKQNPEDFKLGTPEIPTLDEKAVGKVRVSDAFLGDVGKLESTLEQRELTAQDMIRNSGIVTPKDVLKGFFKGKIGDLAKAGSAPTESGQAVKARMQNYIDLLDQSGKKMWDAEQLRSYMQHLWQDNKRLYIPGREATSEEIALSGVTKDINAYLKGKIKGYGKLMDSYSDEVELSKNLKKQLRWNRETDMPQISNWAQNRIVNPLQRVSEGFAPDQWAETLHKFGDIVGRDWQKVIDNNLTYAKMFPDLAAESQKGSWSSQMLKAGVKAVTSPMATVGAAKDKAIDIAIDMATGNANPLAGVQRRAVQERLLEGAGDTIQHKVSFLASAERVIGKQMQTMDDLVQNVLSQKSQRSFVPGSTNAILSVAYSPDGQKGKNKYHALEARRTELAELATNPKAMMDRLQKTVGGMSAVAPTITSLLQQKATTATNYLNTTVPKDPTTGDSIFQGATKWKPSDTELSKFERRLHAIEQPLSVLKDAANGKITPEAVEAVQVVYPKLYEAMKSRTIAYVVKNKEQVPYQTRVQLSILFSAPMDATMRPDFISLMQQGGSSNGPTPPPKGIKKGVLHGDVAAQTQMDRLEGRKQQ